VRTGEIVGARVHVAWFCSGAKATCPLDQDGRPRFTGPAEVAQLAAVFLPAQAHYAAWSAGRASRGVKATGRFRRPFFGNEQ
jgi:hypothetical protein